MPITDKFFFTEHYDEVHKILDKHQTQRCMLGNFKSTGLQMMLDTKETKHFYKVQSDLQKLANHYGVIFAVSFSAFSITGQAIPLPSDALDFKSLKKDLSLSSSTATVDPREQPIPSFPNEIKELLEKAKKMVQDIMELQKIAPSYAEDTNILDEVREIRKHLAQEDDHINKIKARIIPEESREAFFTKLVK